MKYIALMQFQDGAKGPLYNIGDTYPAEGQEPTPERISQLSSTGNRLGRPVIEMVQEPEAPATPDGEPEKPEDTETPATPADEPEEPKEPVTPEAPPVTPGRFPCPHCEKNYAGESWLAKHIKENHPEV